METEIVLLDTSILIDFYRKKDKSKSVFMSLSRENRIFAISVITHFEIFVGASPAQSDYWTNLFHDFNILPLTTNVSISAAYIDAGLKKTRKQIDIPDLFIAATAIVHGLSFSTLNKKHFDRIPGLKMLD